MSDKEKITIRIKVGAKKIWSGIGLIAAGAALALFIGYFFFVGGMV